MKQVDENLVVIDKAAGNKWIWEAPVWHGVIIQTKQLVDLHLFLENLGVLLLLPAEDPQEELAIVAVAGSVLISFGVLGNFFELQIGSTELHHECLLLRLDAEHFDEGNFLILFGNTNNALGIVSHQH